MDHYLQEGGHRMKAKFLIIIGILLISCLGLLNSCCSPEGSCGYAGHCWTKRDAVGQCGVCIKSRCEDVCKACQFNEPACETCWRCLSDDGCRPLSKKNNCVPPYLSCWQKSMYGISCEKASMPGMCGKS